MSYELFSDRARKILQLANSECLEFNHEYVGTEHILLALCKESSGCAAVILRSVNIDYCTVRKEAHKLVQKGPETVMMGKKPLTPRAKNVIAYAQEESKSMGLNYVGTEHILMGLLREDEGVACQILKNLNLDIATARQYVYNFLGFTKEDRGQPDYWIPVRPQTPNHSRLPGADDLSKPSAKEEFEEYVRNYKSPNSEFCKKTNQPDIKPDVNTLFREWMFQKIDKGF